MIEGHTEAATTRGESEPLGLLELETSLEEFLAKPLLSKSSLTSYAKAQKRWAQFCGANGFQALPAPIEAFLLFVACAARGERITGTRGHGPWSPVTLDCHLAAITSQHRQAGYVPAHLDPAHAESFRRIMSGYRRKHGKAGIQAAPVTVEVARQLLSHEPDGNSRTIAYILTAIDSGLPVQYLRSLRARQLVVEAPGYVDLETERGMLRLHCDHRLRVRNVPHPCSACALRGLSRRDPEQFLFAPDKSPDHDPAQLLDAVVRRLVMTWPSLTTTGLWSQVLCLRDDLECAPGTRYGIVTQLSTSGMVVLRTKAMVAMCWHTGMRGGLETCSLNREDVVGGLLSV